MRNLQQCIDLFNCSDSHSKSYAVREMEKISEWSTAAIYWGKILRTEDQQACQMIADSIQKGDNYREKVAHLTEWVENAVENDIMTKEEALRIVYPKMIELQ